MSALYLHIPFCKTRCIYCDFYSTTRDDLRGRYVAALCQELRQRADYLQGEPVRTIYFGGGTPSQLTEADFRAIFDTIGQVFGLQQAEEITLEVNPDDITPDYAAMLSTLPFNRVSMGIQTFHDDTLRLLNRRHTARQAVEAVDRLRRAGFRNISIDLIYGLPGETEERWTADLRRAIELNVEHISAYHLTYEEGTRLHQLLQQRQVAEVSEDASLRFFSLLMDTLQAAGYEHYEISNFARPGCHSHHNSSYWEGIPYLGCGPSAHSYNRTARAWNEPSLLRYIEGVEKGCRPFETETLDLATRYNEYVMTSLRTRRGMSPDEIADRFDADYRRYCERLLRPFLTDGKIEKRDDRYCLTRRGIFVSDSIISELMRVDE